MNKILTFLVAVAVGGALWTHPTEADAKRLGGGRPAGMQRSLPADRAPSPTPPSVAPQNPGGAPANQVAPKPAAATPGATPAQAGRRSWMAPLAGLAAGLGLAALASHLGFGEGLANLMTFALLAMVLFMAVRWWMARRAAASAPAGRLAGAGMPAGFQDLSAPTADRMERRASAATEAVPSANSAGAGPQTAGATMDPEFERLAKTLFIRMQAANDEANVEDLRRFTTPELFASLRVDLQERGAAAQRTDVVQLQAQVVDASEETGQRVVSVRFQGLIREVEGQAAQPFDELWHLVQPQQGDGAWRVAGITPVA